MIDETKATGEVALALAQLAHRCVGPEGTVVRVPAEDTALLRSTFVSRVAEAAIKLLEAGV